MRVARVVELVDALDSKSSTARCVGSSPTSGTTYHLLGAPADCGCGLMAGCLGAKTRPGKRVWSFPGLPSTPDGGTGSIGDKIGNRIGKETGARTPLVINFLL